MAELVISGVQPYDGRYDLDLEQEFTTREWGWVKRLAGYLPVTLDDNAFSDPELACVLAAIVLHRSGKVERAEVPAVFEQLADAPFGTTITIAADEVEEEEDAGPPASNSNGSSNISGDVSPTSSETSAPTPPATGTRDSGSSVSGRPMSVT